MKAGGRPYYSHVPGCRSLDEIAGRHVDRYEAAELCEVTRGLWNGAGCPAGYDREAFVLAALRELERRAQCRS